MNETHPSHCQNLEPLLSAYLLGELEASEASTVTTHLDACPSCREQLALLRSTAELVAKTSPQGLSLSDDGRARILSTARTAKQPRRFPFARVAAALAAAALVAVATSPFWNDPGNPVDPAPAILVAGSEPVSDRREADGVSLTAPAVELALLPPATKKTTMATVATGTAPAAAPESAPAKAPESAPALKAGDVMRDTELARRSKLPQPGAGGRGTTTTSEPDLLAAAPEERLASIVERSVQGGGGGGALPGATKQDSNTDFTLGIDAKSKKSAEERPRDLASGGALRLRNAIPDPFGAGTEVAAGREQEYAGLEYKDDKDELAKLSNQPVDRPFPAEEVRRRADAEGFAAGLADKSGVQPAEADGTKPATPLPSEPAAAAPGAPLVATEITREKQPATRPALPTRNWKLQVDEILTTLDRKAGESPDLMLHRFWGDNPFVEASADALSTFGADVDTASYSLFRGYLTQRGVLPPKEAVRTEEFVNYFRGHYAPPTEEGRAFAVHTDCAPSPFAHESEYKLLRIGIKGREISREKRKACSLVFVIDTSGSMRQGNRLETVKAALRLLVNELDEGDTIGVVAFDFEARTIIEPTPASAKERILDAISSLEPRRNTNVAAGLALGYNLAASRMIKDGAHRVILLSDGVANTGVTDAQTMLAQVQSERQKGIYLTTVGVGMGNLNDALLSELATRGNGQCVYVDRVEEAKKVFVDNLTGTLEAIARDMKVQVDFDASKVLRYRLLGYEKRAVADADFRNNAVDAGEIGAGHEVTALYELKLKPEATGTFATVRVRHLTVEHGEAQELATPIEVASIKAAFADGSPRYRLHVCVAELAEVLRESYWARGGSLERVTSLLKEQMDLREREGGPTLGEDPDVVELLALVQRSDALIRQRLAEQTDVVRTLEALKENVYLGARVEDELARRQDQNRTQIDEIRRRNEELRRQLDSLLAQ